MAKSTGRAIFTLLMYVGILVFLFPYITGRISTAIPFLMAGAAIAIASGMLRCYFMEHDSKEGLFTPRIS